MSRRFWTEEELQRLRSLVEAGEGYSTLAAALGRTNGSINRMIRKLGINIDPEAVKRRRMESNQARKGEKRQGKPCSPEHRERLRSYCAKMNSDPAIRAEAIEKMRQWKRSPEGRAKSREARERHLAKTFGGWPPQFREQYRFLTRQKGIPAIEARAMIEPQIAAFLQTFDGQLWRVQTGQARIVEVAPVASRHFDQSLTGCSLAQ